MLLKLKIKIRFAKFTNLKVLIKDCITLKVCERDQIRDHVKLLLILKSANLNELIKNKYIYKVV